MQHPKVVGIASRHKFKQVAVIDLSVICAIANSSPWFSKEIRFVAEYEIIGHGLVLHFRVLPPHCSNSCFRWKSKEEVVASESLLWGWIANNFEELMHPKYSPWRLLRS